MNASDQHGSPGSNASLSQMMKLFESFDETEEKLHILDQLFKFSRDFICVTGPNGYFKRVSESFCQALGYTQAELLAKPQDFFMVDKFLEGVSIDSDTEEDEVDPCAHNRYRCKDGTIKWFAWRYADFTADQHTYAIGRDITRKRKLDQELRETANQLEAYKHENLEGLRYAQRLQNAILPSVDSLAYFLPDSFILYSAKHIISGDFFWFDRAGFDILVAAGDCTGHGVPGALLSVTGVNMLNTALHQQRVAAPAALLNKLDGGLNNILNDKYTGKKMHDGMDISICSINFDKLVLNYAAVNNSIYIVRENILIELKSQNYEVGAFLESHYFDQKEFHLQKNDMIYLFSDGFADQFGGPSEKKFGYTRFREMLVNVATKPAAQQKIEIETILKQWQGDLEQTDDILLMGIKI